MPVTPEFLGGPNGWLGYTAVMILLIAFFWRPVKVIWSRLNQPSRNPSWGCPPCRL